MSIQYVIEARVNGVWAREHAGCLAGTEFFHAEAAKETIPLLADNLGCKPSELRVVEIKVSP